MRQPFFHGVGGKLIKGKFFLSHRTIRCVKQEHNTFYRECYTLVSPNDGNWKKVVSSLTCFLLLVVDPRPLFHFALIVPRSPPQGGGRHQRAHGEFGLLSPPRSLLLFSLKWNPSSSLLTLCIFSFQSFLAPRSPPPRLLTHPRLRFDSGFKRATPLPPPPPPFPPSRRYTTTSPPRRSTASGRTLLVHSPTLLSPRHPLLSRHARP